MLNQNPVRKVKPKYGQYEKPAYKRNLSKNYGMVIKKENIAALIYDGLNHDDSRYHGLIKITRPDGTVEYIDPITRAKIE